MAYLQKLPEQKCRCGRRAVVELFNNLNAPLGIYCRPCGNRAIKEQQSREALHIK